MAWTDPKTWSAGSTLAAAELNEQVRDNLTYLKAIADGVEFSGVKARRDADQSIPNTTYTEVNFDQQYFDYGGWFAPTSTDIIVPATAIPDTHTHCMLLVAARAQFANNSTGSRRIRLYNGGTLFGQATIGGLSGDSTEVNLTEFVLAEAADVITAQVYQSSGGALDLEFFDFNVVKFAPVTV